jgi:hypothetical protein
MRLRIVVTIALFTLVGIFAAGQKKTNAASAVGHWRLNVDKSDYGQMPKPKSGTLNITSDTAASAKWSASIAYPDGKKETYSYSGAEDGKPHPVTGNNPWKSAAYSRSDSGVASADITMKDGSSLKQEFTIEGDTMTVKNTTAQGSGTEVWERIKGASAKP